MTRLRKLLRGYDEITSPTGWNDSEEVSGFAADLSLKAKMQIDSDSLYQLLVDNIYFLSFPFDEVISLIMNPCGLRDAKDELFRQVFRALRPGPNLVQVFKPLTPSEPKPIGPMIEEHREPDWVALWSDLDGQHCITTRRQNGRPLIQHRTNGRFRGEVEFFTGDPAIKDYFDERFQAANSPREFLEWFFELQSKMGQSD